MKYYVIVDMQNDFITGVLGTPAARAARDNLVEKLSTEEEERKLFFTMDTHFREDYLKSKEGQFLPIEHCLISTDGWELDEKLRPFQENGKTAFKTTFGTKGIGHSLMRAGFDTKEDVIEICGLCTDICVISNALILRSAIPEATIRLDSSCCAGSNPANHEAALAVMKACNIEVY